MSATKAAQHGRHRAPAPVRSERRRPEETVLYQAVQAHWDEFRERAEEGGGLPSFVTKELDEYLTCGILEHGFLRLGCLSCGYERLVGFSCKRRGFCPSCPGRRMTDSAIHLAEEVFPPQMVRQWVCSLPWKLRSLLGYDKALCAEVLAAFTQEVRRSLRRRAKTMLGLSSMSEAHTGGVTFIQRFDSALRLNVHLHSLFLDGVFVRDEDGELEFHELDEPSPEQVAEVAKRTAARVIKLLEKAGRPRFNMIRFHGVFAPNAKLRSEVVPKKEPRKLATHSAAELGDAEQTHLFEDEPAKPKRHPWAWLLKNVFLVDVTECPDCGGRMKWLEVCTERRDIHRVLSAQGLAPRAPPQVGWTPLGQLRFSF